MKSYPMKSYPMKSYPMKSYPMKSYLMKSYPMKSYLMKSYPLPRRLISLFNVYAKQLSFLVTITLKQRKEIWNHIFFQYFFYLIKRKYLFTQLVNAESCE